MFTFFRHFSQLARHETQTGCDKVALSSAPLKEALQRASTVPSEEALEAAAAMHATGAPLPKRVTRTNNAEKEIYIPSAVEMLVGVAATDLSFQVSELSGTIERLESTIAEQADEIRELKEQNKTSTAIKREKDKKTAKEELQFDESNTTDFEHSHRRCDAFKALDAALQALGHQERREDRGLLL
jgi:cell division protein FtsL